jgi:hypothetical protein
MLDEEELEQVREGCSSSPSGKIIKKNLAVTLFVSVFILSVVLYLSFSSLMTVGMATSVSGAGGFIVSIEEVTQQTGDEFFIHPVAAETSECENTVNTAEGRPNPTDSDQALPALRAQIENAQITDNTSISFKKGIKTPNIVGIDNFVVSINNNLTDVNGNLVGYGPVEINNASLIVSELSARRLQLTNAKINERRSNDQVTASEPDFETESPFGPTPQYRKNPDPAELGELVVSGEGVKIEDATAVAHYVGFTSLVFGDALGSPPGILNLEIKYDVNNPPIPNQNCPV